MDTSIKIALHSLCQQQVDQRITTAKEAMDAAQAAANNEGKSSAGDKYETGRAMMQLERDQHARSLAEALKLKQVLDNIDPTKTCLSVYPGCLVETSAGSFFISISLGRLMVGNIECIAISAASPIGLQLMGKQAGDQFEFAKRQARITKLI